MLASSFAVAMAIAAMHLTVTLHPPMIPDGCLDIIFDLNHSANLRSFVVGAMTKPFLNRKINLVGVRFKPGMAYPFFQYNSESLSYTILQSSIYNNEVL